MKYHIVTFGCQQNVADSERIASAYENRGFQPAESLDAADEVIVNTCMIRESAENRVYGLVRNLSKQKELGKKIRIVVTGCMVGMAVREKSGAIMRRLRRVMPLVDEFLPIEEAGYGFLPLRTDREHAWVPITNGCNNFCTYCVVPFTRGREVSRPYEDILSECRELAAAGYGKITLLGQNVNSYGSDLFVNKRFSGGRSIPDPVYVRHLGRLRIPTLFPQLLSAVAGISGRVIIDFISSNPWDFSDELIKVIAEHRNISRMIHLPVQSGDDNVLKRMNRWYTAGEYLQLVNKIKKLVPDAIFTTDIIVGFCGETPAEFSNTVKLVKKVGFQKAYISVYSDRKITRAHKTMQDDVPFSVKKKRWQKLEEIINLPGRKLIAD